MTLRILVLAGALVVAASALGQSGGEVGGVPETPRQERRYRIDFRSTDLQLLTQAMERVLGMSIQYDNRLRGEATVVADGSSSETMREQGVPVAALAH